MKETPLRLWQGEKLKKRVKEKELEGIFHNLLQGACYLTQWLESVT